MIDFHSHVLPNVDDGSSSVEESLAMLRALKQQGVNTVCATPHFDATTETVEEFLKKRQSAYESLLPHLDDSCPRILLGAEVAYYEGISRLEDLTKLRLEGTRVLLLEMPFCRWSGYALTELRELSCAGRIQLMLAHVERYRKFQKPGVFDKLLEYGIVMQVNASYFLDWRTRRKALRMLDKGIVHVLGTDCHNMEHRPPRIGEAFDTISKRFGDGMISEMERFGKYLIRKRRI